MTSSNQYFIDEAENGMGACLVLTAPWSNRLKSIIEKEKISVLRLSQAAGWEGDDISFVQELPELRGIEIYSWKVKDITPLQTLTGLEYLGLQCEFTRACDFSKFERLKICKLLWRPKAKSVFSCNGLSLLNIVNYPMEDLTALQNMSDLTRLQLTSKKLSALAGIEHLGSLSTLDLAECTRLVDLSGVERCHQLETIEIEGCKKVYDLNLLGELKKLKTLVLANCGKVKSLTPLSECKQLESVNFVGDTNIEDGALASLLDIPTLKKMWFVNKRHYSHNREQVDSILS